VGFGVLDAVVYVGVVVVLTGPRTQTRLQIWRILRRGGMTRWRAFKMATGTFGAKRITYIRDQQERR